MVNRLIKYGIKPLPPKKSQPQASGEENRDKKMDVPASAPKNTVNSDPNGYGAIATAVVGAGVGLALTNAMLGPHDEVPPSVRSDIRDVRVVPDPAYANPGQQELKKNVETNADRANKDNKSWQERTMKSPYKPKSQEK